MQQRRWWRGLGAALLIGAAGLLGWRFWPAAPPPVEAPQASGGESAEPVEAPSVEASRGASSAPEPEAAPAPQASGELQVCVEDEGGAPVADARVEVLSPRREARSSEEGDALLGQLPAGEVSLRVEASGRSTVTMRVEVVEGEVSSVNVTLPPLQGISGRVVLSTGAPAEGARVVLWPEGAPGSRSAVLALGGGAFRLEGLDVGRYVLQASHPSSSPSAEVIVEAGASGVELSLEAGGAIAGEVRSAGGERLSGGFSVVVEGFEPAADGLDAPPISVQRFGAASAGADGGFLLEGLAPGRYDLYADAPGLGGGVLTGVQVRGGRTAGPVTITLEPGATLEGRVFDAATRRPVVGAAVGLEDDERRGRGLAAVTATTDEAGRFALEGVAPGRRSLRVAAVGYTTRLVAGVQIGRGAAVRLEVGLTAQEEGSKPQVEFFGIGAVLEPTPEGGIRVREALEGGPGVRSGLQVGDAILTVDGQEVSSLGLQRTVGLIRGEEGASVELEIQRGGDPYPMTVVVERGRVVY